VVLRGLIAEALRPACDHGFERRLRHDRDLDELGIKSEGLRQRGLDLEATFAASSLESRNTFPLAMYVETFSNPRPSRRLRSSAMGTLFLPPTLIPRRSTR
jgi:hypothetical protein